MYVTPCSGIRFNEIQLTETYLLPKTLRFWDRHAGRPRAGSRTGVIEGQFKFIHTLPEISWQVMAGVYVV
ncbi:hypothetical protein BH23BAC3_BH23BAC3_02100 [soil metagenome]